MLEHVEREGPTTENVVVELTHVESRSERGLALLPELFDLQLADLVAHAWPGHAM